MLPIYRFLTRLLTIIALATVLIQCTPVRDNPLQVNEQLTSPYTMPAAAYLALAANQPNDEKKSLEMMAAGRLIYDGEWQQGLRIISQLRNLSPDLTNTKNMLLAKIDLMRNHPDRATRRLSSVHDVGQLPLYNQVQYHEMLASAYRATDNATEAVAERIKLEKLLPDEASRANNRRALWLTVTTLPLAEIDTLAIEAPEESELKGWMQLGLISRQQHQDATTMIAKIESWKAQYPRHSGNFILPSPLSQTTPHLVEKPKQIALLLPLTGQLAGPGKAVYEGFMDSLKADETSSDVTVKPYDTGSEDAKILYHKAINEGANYVVGPLGKSSAASVGAIAHPVPTLLLNDLNTSAKDHNVYQFGIAPSNEARQVAVKARNNGNTRALIIAPNDAWGHEITTAFSQQWQRSGGKVIDTLNYRTDEDMNTAVRNTLHVSESEVRGNVLKTLLGKTIQFTPRRRQDFDMIFLLAYPSKARQIMPMLRYYYAGNVPVYAISTVYSGTNNTLKDRDLNGIIFCDMPWVFEHQVEHKNWPEQWNSFSRLYALGRDSYKLSTQLNQLLLFPAMGVSDESGILYLKANQQIGRILTWGKFEQGIAKPIHDS